MAFSDRDVELYYADRDPAYTQIDEDLEAEKELKEARAVSWFRHELNLLIDKASACDMAEAIQKNAEYFGEYLTEELEGI